VLALITSAPEIWLRGERNQVAIARVFYSAAFRGCAKANTRRSA